MLAFHIIEIICVVLMLAVLLLVLFEPPLRYDVRPPAHPPDSEEFLRLLGALADAQVHRGNRIEPLSDGENFYAGELAAIRSAKSSVHVEVFIFDPSPIAEQVRDALAERAQAGVMVRVIVDSIGSLLTPKRFFDPLIAAGGHVAWYQPIAWYTLKRFNNRTHRDLLIIDGCTGFIGGAGFANHWQPGDRGRPPWPDAMYRIHGPLVAGLQTCFAENWLESSSEILSDERLFPAILDLTSSPGTAGKDRGGGLPRSGVADESDARDLRRQPRPQPSPGVPGEGERRGGESDDVDGFVVISSPTPGRSTRNRIVFQTLLATARQSIDLNTPYLLPDRSAQRELAMAVKRGVRVRLVVPGKHNNHPVTRLASRRRYGHLLQNGVEIFEYQPGMLHAKAMIIDGLWVVVGSTNLDSRSFDLNDEVNVAARSPALAQRVTADFEQFKSQSRQITFEAWQHRKLIERIAEQVFRIFERQE